MTDRPERPVEHPLWEQWSAANAARRTAEGPQAERLQKVLATRGWGSRRVCEDLIAAGRVTVNGEVAVLGRRVDPDVDVVEVDGAPVGTKADLVHYLLNKPAGIVTTANVVAGLTTSRTSAGRASSFQCGRIAISTRSPSPSSLSGIPVTRASCQRRADHRT